MLHLGPRRSCCEHHRGLHCSSISSKASGVDLSRYPRARTPSSDRHEAVRVSSRSPDGGPAVRYSTIGAIVHARRAAGSSASAPPGRSPARTVTAVFSCSCANGTCDCLAFGEMRGPLRVERRGVSRVITARGPCACSRCEPVQWPSWCRVTTSLRKSLDCGCGCAESTHIGTADSASAGPSTKSP